MPDGAFKQITYNAVLTVTSGADVTTGTFGSQTYWIRISNDQSQTSTAIVKYQVGPAATVAVGTGTAYATLPPAWVEYIHVTPGEKLAAKTTAGTSILTVTELA
jgi:hypothetical protein